MYEHGVLKKVRMAIISKISYGISWVKSNILLLNTILTYPTNSFC